MNTTRTAEARQHSDDDSGIASYRARPQTLFGTRTRRCLFAAVSLAGLVVAAMVLEAARMPDIDAVAPAGGSYIAARSFTIRLSCSNIEHLDTMTVRLDGRDVTARLTAVGSVVSLYLTTVRDGTHTVTFCAKSDNLFRRVIRRSWRFAVDTRTPELDLTALQQRPIVTAATAVFAGMTEPLATVSVRMGTIEASATANARGHYRLAARLSEGTYRAVFTVRDRAGNRSQQHLILLADFNPPHLVVGPVAATLHTTAAHVRIAATDSTSEPVVSATVNGKEVSVAGESSGCTLHLADLPQGKTTIRVRATDKAGRVVAVTRSFIVDSTETMGDATMISGARGDDVRELQRRLRATGVLGAGITGTYDQATVKAVRRLQARYGLTSDGVVGPQMLALLSGRHIVVDLSRCRLYLYAEGRLLCSYRVATGRRSYPTPTGTYAILEKIRNPTWVPPDSAWAKDAVAVEPGEGNPLGTRWMGLSADGIGIHGVPPSEASSIGTHASHGCIRMLNSDAIDLFSRVSVGTRVVIRA